MKKLFYLVLYASILPLNGYAQEKCTIQSGPLITPLVELYTSEGCSSCPPADRWLSKQIKQDNTHKANYLAFHVDYWDDIGWPDRFADAKYTQRQRQRVSAANGSTVYTPQTMQGRNTTLQWYRADKVEASLSESKKQSALIDIQLSAEKSPSPSTHSWRTQLNVRSKTKQAQASLAYLALYEDNLVTQVKAGENRGETLKHDRVVRGLFGPWPLVNGQLQKTLDIKPPAGLNKANAGLIVFVQSIPDHDNLQSLRLANINQCSD
jgi:hypothetical protein